MLEYNKMLKQPSRDLRSNMTEAEQLLWQRIRRKQIEGVQFYRQKPIGHYIVDFYSPAARLVIEVDGSQHQAVEHKRRDAQRDDYLNEDGLVVLRFNNLEVLTELDAVVEKIFSVVKERMNLP